LSFLEKVEPHLHKLQTVINQAGREEIDMGDPGASSDQKGVRRHLQILFLFSCPLECNDRNGGKKSPLCVTFLSKTDITFTTSVSKFHKFRVTQDLLSFPDWLMAFNRQETVFHVHVLAFLSSHKSGADYY
jgi:hypothetical protein